MIYDTIIAIHLRFIAPKKSRTFFRLVAAPFLPVPARIAAAAGPFAAFTAGGAMQVLWPGAPWEEPWKPHPSGDSEGESMAISGS